MQLPGEARDIICISQMRRLRLKTWKQPKCPSAHEWIKKRWYIQTVECYLAIKKNEIMPFAATWMELETIILSEVSHRKTNII